MFLSPVNASFSPPSLSLSLKEQQLEVEVSFPCAPNAICPAMNKDEDDYEEDNEEEIPTCCPVTDFLPMNTTVTLYNKHDQNEIQVINSAMLFFTS